MTTRRVTRGIVLLLLVAWVDAATARPKTDIVQLVNGDRVTCEIKSLSRGRLTVKTDAMSTISIEWQDVVGLDSNFYFRVESSSGSRLFGTVKLVVGEDEVRVGVQRTVLTIPKQQVVEITPIEENFFSRFEGSLTIGFSYTKGSHVAQLTADWTTRYRTERNYYDLKAKSIVTDTGSEGATTRRNDVSVAYTRLILQKWFGNTSLAWQRNDELNIKRRFIGSLGAGLNPLKSNRQLILLSTGLAVNSELAADTNVTRESLEVAISAEYSLFVYDSPKRDINVGLDVYPSLTEARRYRLGFDTKLRFEIIKDLFFDLSYYVDFDNKPPNNGSKSDTGIVTSIGWSY